MKYILKFSVNLIVIVLLAQSFQELNGQVYRFKNIGTENGIPSGFVYTVNQDQSGYLWIGTGSGISKFDGFSFFNIPFPDSTLNRFPTASVTDTTGRIWFGCNDGTLFCNEKGGLRKVEIQSGRSISQIINGPDGEIWIIPQGEVIYCVDPFSSDAPRRFEMDPSIVLFSGAFTPDGDLLLGTQENIILVTPSIDTLITRLTIGGFDYAAVQAIQPVADGNTYLIGTNGSGIFSMEADGRDYRLSKFANNHELDAVSVQSIMMDSDGTCWVATNESGVSWLKLDENATNIEWIKFFSIESGMSGSSVRLVFRDIEGNHWFGTNGAGLSVLNSLAFSFHAPGLTPDANNIIHTSAIAPNYFLGTPEGYYLYDIDKSKVISFSDLLKYTGKNEVSAYSVEPDGTIWFGTKGSGLYRKSPDGQVRLVYQSGNSGEDYINDIVTDARNVWIATLNGVIIINKQSGPFERYSINNGLPHNNISQIFLTGDGSAIIGSKTDRIYSITPGVGVTSGNLPMAGTTINNITSVCADQNGAFWAATAGNGLFMVSGDSLTSYTRADMLMSDYCYGVIADQENRIWIGHERGFSRLNTASGILRTFSTDFALGGVCNSDAMFESPDGKILIGTNQGLIVYDPSWDNKVRLAPLNNVNYLTINNREYPFAFSYTLPYKKAYTIRVHYTGINLRDPEKVYYQTKLENWTDEWSKLSTEREVTLSPRDGRYRFLMTSVNEDGLSGSPVSFELIIKKPFWRTWYFILSMIFLISGAGILIVREREKAQKKQREELEKELAARTSVVMKQKAELELQNIEITDSINYAKRIQTSILPDFNKLKEVFSDAFILFRPRDIVSGDFYWFDKVGDDRFVLVCADSTGHGVPGAFMSMIGATLLQDIVTRQKITKPSEILSILDTQIFATLNQNVEMGVSNDGMDMVVCEINTKAKHLRFASAMRPVILVIENEPYYVKGNRSSVGGEAISEKYFDDQEYYLNNGDTLYLFSDGLPDQFGGSDGKKMKIARLKKLIEDVSGLSMSGQKEVISKYFDEWKGDYEQVDDILIIGIRF